jgi:hypothetical protein
MSVGAITARYSFSFTAASSLRAKCDLPYIGSEEDLEQWIAALRAVAAEELKKGNRISL